MSESDVNGVRERRRHSRARLTVEAKLELGARPAISCEVYDMSAGGALVEQEQAARLGERAILHLDGFGPVAGHVARVTSTVIALAFENPDGAALARFIDRHRLSSGTARRTTPARVGEL